MKLKFAPFCSSLWKVLSHECPPSLVQATAEGCFQRDFLFGRDDLSSDGYPLGSTEDRERRGGRGVRV